MSDALFKPGDRVEKFSGDYTGPGIVRKVIDDIPGRLRYVVGHRIEGGSGEFWHIYSPQQLRPFKD